MPNFGNGSELEEAGPDNGIDLFVEIQVPINYNTQVLSMWSDVGGEVIEVLGNSSSMMWGAKEQDLCLVLI